MFTITKPRINLLALSLFILPNIGWAGDSCNALLNLGLYNVTQSSSASDGQAMAKSSFCSADYSQIDSNSSQAGQISASYGIFSGGASGSASRSEIITKQSQVCTSGFNSSSYSQQASDYSKTVYQGSLDAWNKCQSLANKGIVFNVVPSSTLQGVNVSITASTGLSAKFLGVAQQGSGHSDCTTSANGKLLNVGLSTPFKFTAASIVTINCARQLDANGQDLIADAQDLIFMTSADNLAVPLQAIGNMSRVSVDQINANVSAAINKEVSPITNNLSALTTQVNGLSNTIKVSTTFNYQGKNVNWRKMIYCHFPGVDIMLRPEAFGCPTNYFQDTSFGSFSILVD